MSKIHEQFLEITRLAMETAEHQSVCGPAVFVTYYPHVDALDVRVYKRGWHDFEDPTESYGLYVNGVRRYQPDGNPDLCLKAVQRALEDAIALEGLKQAEEAANDETA